MLGLRKKPTAEVYSLIINKVARIASQINKINLFIIIKKFYYIKNIIIIK